MLCIIQYETLSLQTRKVAFLRLSARTCIYLITLYTYLIVMEGWHKLQSSIGTLNLGQSANKLAKGFNSSVQATKERLGQVAPDEITELPQGE